MTESTTTTIPPPLTPRKNKTFSKAGILPTNVLEVDLCLGDDEGSVSLTLKWMWHERSATQVTQSLQRPCPQLPVVQVGRLNLNMYTDGRQLVKQQLTPATEDPHQAAADSLSQELSAL